MYYENQDIDYQSIKDHVRDGMGFYGTCAGTSLRAH
jgi:glutamine amidotransferase PdxT